MSAAQRRLLDLGNDSLPTIAHKAHQPQAALARLEGVVRQGADLYHQITTEHDHHRDRYTR